MMNVDQRQHDILKGKNIAKIILLLSLPIMFSSILKTLHDLVDMYVVSSINGPKAVVDAQVAAVTFTTPIISVCQGLATGIMIAGSALMSQYIGALKFEKARKVSGQLMLFCIVIGIILNIILFIFAPKIIQSMNATDELYNYSVRYVRVRSFELIGLFIFFAFQATRQSMGDTITPVVLNVIAVIINIILSIFFISVLKTDLTGAAWGTVIGNLVILPVCFWQLKKDRHFNMNMDLETLKYDGKVLRKIFALGWPAAISQSFTSLGFLLINSMIAGFNQDIFSSIGVGNRINSLLLFPAIGIGSVLATFVGQNIGAGNRERARKGFHTAIFITLVITIVGALVLMPFRPFLTSIFLKEEEAINLAAFYLFILLCNLPLMGTFQCFNGVFQGSGRTDLVLILATTRLWIMRVPVLYLFLYVFDVGTPSVWYAMIISNAGANILGAALYLLIDFKPRLSGMRKRLGDLTGVGD